jgi:hypothetical protein
MPLTGLHAPAATTMPSVSGGARGAVGGKGNALPHEKQEATAERTRTGSYLRIAR